jgi:hypothetical protein
METQAIDPTTNDAFVKLYDLCKYHGFSMSQATPDLYPNSTIAYINLINEPPSLRVSDTYLIGYSFASGFPGKSLLTVETVLENFEALVLKRDHLLLDHLYREAFKKPDRG